MPGNSINDWSLELGFDASKVDKGLSRIEKRLNKFNKSTSGKSRTRKVSPTNLVGEQRGSTTKVGNAIAAANALERKRQSAEAAIRKGRSLKLDTTSAGGSLKSKDAQVIEKERLSLLRRIKEQEVRITAERLKQAKTKRVDRLTLNQRLTQEGRIDRVKSEAGFAAKSLSGSDDEKSVSIKRRLNAEVRKLNTAQKNLANTTFTNTKKYEKLRRSVNKSTQRVRDLKREMMGLRKVGGGSGGGIIGTLTGSFKRLGVAAVSAYAVIAGGQALFQAIKRLDSLKASLLAASGSAGQAKIDFEFVRQTSKSLGRDLFVSAKGFQAIGAAMRGAFTQGQTKDVFLAASEASTAFGLSMEDTQGVMRAFSQIASKGTVQAEELRGQLGDRLPGAFQIAAKAMGLTTDELNKMLKSGKVLSKEFLPKFAAELRRTVRDSGALAAGINTVVAAQNRMNTSLTEAAERIGEAGGEEIFKDVFKIITKIVNFLTPLGTAVVRILQPIVKSIAGWVDLIFQVLTPLAEIVGILTDLVVSFVELISETGDWLFGVERVNVEIDGTMRKVSLLVRAFQIVAGVLNIIRGSLLVARGLANDIASVVSDVFGDEATKDILIKGGEKVSSSEANIMEANDRMFNALSQILPIDKRDRTGRIGVTAPVINADIKITEANDPDLVRKEVQTGIQDALSAAMKDDQ